MTWFLPVVIVLGLGADATSLEPPTKTRVLLKAVADGVQVYTCEGAAGGAFQWVFKAPDAVLFDTEGRQIGKHFAGPSWQSSDGSLVTAEVAAKAPAPQPDSIPWLLLKAKSHSGSGAFTRVTFVQRTETQGGSAPKSGCDAAHRGDEARMRYSATYSFHEDAP